jgi:multidrug efflux pump subunit AcrA (membrane-fusion protein)
MNALSSFPPLAESLEELLSPSRELRKGWLIAGLFFIGLLGWAAVTPLDAGAMAQGIVAVSGSRQAVQHRDGGIVTAINVTEGQLVKKGDLLVTISTSELVASEKGMAGEVANLFAMRARLETERDGRRNDPARPRFSRRGLSRPKCAVLCKAEFDVSSAGNYRSASSAAQCSNRFF